MRNVFFALSAAAACTGPALAIPPVESDVSGYAEYGVASGQRYFLAASAKDQNGTLEFNSFTKHVEKALATKQLIRVAQPQEAEIVIFLDYGIGPPNKEVASYSLPTFGQTGVGSSSTFGRVSSTGSVSATTTYTPRFGITGSSSHVYSYTTYDRWMRLSAYSLAGNSERELWRTEVKSSGSTGDLRRIFPIMVYSSIKYVGTDTGRAVTVKVKEKNKDYRAFLGN
jgi:hypothetical protein